MARIYSWKLTDTKNAYLYVPNSKKHITERIVDNEILSQIINKISSWSEERYIKAFDEMNTEIEEMFGEKIIYDSKFYGDKTVSNNMVVLSSSRNDYKEIINKYFEDLKRDLLLELDKRVNSINEEIFESYRTLKEENKQQTDVVVKSFQRKLNETIKTNEEIKSDIEKRFEKAENSLQKAAKILELNDNYIDVDAFKDLFKNESRTRDWLTTYSGNLETISHDYSQVASRFKSNGKKEKVFDSMLAHVDNVSKRTEEMEQKVVEVDKKVKYNEPVLGSRRTDVFEYTSPNGFTISVDDNLINIHNPNSNAKIMIDDKSIFIDGDVIINGKKIK